MALNGSTVVGLANDTLISFPVSQSKWNAFGRIKSLGVTELDFWNEESTRNVDPVVVGCAFQRFSWKCWTATILLLQTVCFTELNCEFLFDSFSFTISIVLLLVRHSWSFK